MTEEEKIELFEQLINHTYTGKDLDPALDDIYSMFDHECTMICTPEKNCIKIRWIDGMIPPIKKLIENNDLELFHKIANQVTHPKNNKISSRMIFDIIDLLQFPYEYCNRDNNYLVMLTDYFIEEDNYEFYLENSNYLYFYYLSQVINKTKEHELKAGFFEALLIYYFLTNNADINNFDSTLDYIIKNRKYLSTYFQQNYVDGHGEDFFDIIMSKILSQENNKTIK